MFMQSINSSRVENTTVIKIYELLLQLYLSKFHKLRQSRKSSLSHRRPFHLPLLKHTWHSRPILHYLIAPDQLISLHLSISVDVPLHATSSLSRCPPMVRRIWEATTRFVRYDAMALAIIRTSRQLVNSNLRFPLIEERIRDCTGGQMKRFSDATGCRVIIVSKM